MAKSLITEIREKYHLTQDELSKIIGVSPTAVSLYEKGTRSPSKKTMRKLMYHFHLTQEDLENFSDAPAIQKTEDVIEMIREDSTISLDDLEFIRNFLMIPKETRKQAILFFKLMGRGITTNHTES